MPTIRRQPEDFVVDEILLYPPRGDGAHTYLRVEKRDLDTARAARLVADAAGVPVGAVGWAGRKDRHAVTRQWLSVPGLDPDAARRFELPGITVLEAVRHTEKLHAGELWGNRFRVVVRDLGDDEAERATRILAELSRRGMPNRFGVQRFGRDGANAERGAEILARPRFRGDRRQARLMVSALQSAVFNDVVARRAEALGELWPGDLAIDHETGLILEVPDPAAMAAKLASFRISPTGPIFGSRMKRPRGRPAELERAVLAERGLDGLDDRDFPRGLTVPGGRRALRVLPRQARATRTADGLVLELELPAGSYATVLLEACFPDGLDDDRREPTG